MELLTKDNLTLAWNTIWMLAVIGGLITFLRYCLGGVSWTFAFTRARKLRRLRNRRAWLIQLHESDREYYGWLLSSVLGVLAVFAIEMVLRAQLSVNAARSPQDQTGISLIIGVG